MAIEERINRLKTLVQKMPQSVEAYQKIMRGKGSQELLDQKKELMERWEEIEDILYSSKSKMGQPSIRETFLEKINQDIKDKGVDYIKVIQGLDKTWSSKGTQWLQGIVDEINECVLEKIPSFKISIEHRR